MYENQTLNFVLKMKQKYSELNNVKTPNKAFEFLDSYRSFRSDLDEPNSLHAYQTAERIKKNT